MYRKRGNGTLWGIVLMASFVILIFVFVKFGDKDKILEENSTYAGNYYKPGTYTKSVQAANQLYAQMSGSYNVGCRKVDLVDTNKGLVFVEKLPSPYNKMCMFVASSETSRFFDGVSGRTSLAAEETWSLLSMENKASYYEAGNSVAMSDPNTNLVYIDCLLDINMQVSKSMASGDVKIFDLFPGIPYLIDSTLPYVEIVAPFDFSFLNNNTDGEQTPEKIVILSSSGDVKMTFDNCANWYCAGEPAEFIPGGEALNNGNVEDVSVAWNEHGRGGAPHYTIIGPSKNAYVRGGSYGKVIGYADADTTVKIEVLENGEWRQITLKSWLTESNM